MYEALTGILAFCAMYVLIYNVILYFSKANPGEDTGTDTGEDTGTDTGEDTGTDTGEDTGADTGEDTGADTGEDTGADTGADIGTDSSKVNSTADQIKYLQNRYKGKLFPARVVECELDLGDVCPKDGDILFEHDAVLDSDRNYNHILRNVKCCDACNTVFVPALSNKMVHFDDTSNTLYINKRIHDCKRNKHCIVAVTGIVRKIDGDILKINVEYCFVCGKYFIEEEQFNRYKELYGIILGNFKCCSTLSGGYNPFMKDHSLLNLCGYNVGQKDNLSSISRHKILRYLMENDLMSKPEIIKYLDYFISLNAKQINKKLAVKKWKEDLDYVNIFRIDKQREIDFR
mgnify:CR=1 FL=1